MKKRLICKIVVDMLMIILLLLLMARQVTGDLAHEWLGAGMFVLWIVHHILNRNWYRNLFKGKYTPARILQIIIHIALFFFVICFVVSSVILSREVFVFLPVSGGIALARSLHMICAFWGFALMALHLGLHWNMILAMARKVVGPFSSKLLRIILRMTAVLFAGYGFYAFIRNQFPSYMFLKSHFVFYDFEKPALIFFTEYIAIMGLFIFLAYYTSKGIQKLTVGRKTGEKKKE